MAFTNGSVKYAQRDMLRAILKEQEQEKIQKELDKVPSGFDKFQQTVSDEKVYTADQKRLVEAKTKQQIKETATRLYTHKLLESFLEASLSNYLNTDRFKSTRQGLVDTFIESQGGSLNVLKTIKSRSYILGSIVEAAEKSIKATYDKTITLREENDLEEEIDKPIYDPESEDSLAEVIDKNDDELKDIGDRVHTVVANSVERFIINNIEDKENIKDIMSGVEEKISTISAVNDEEEKEIKESVIKTGKQKINKINSRKKSLFEYMVLLNTKQVIKNNHTKAMKEDGSLDMQYITDITEATLTMIVLGEALGFDIKPIVEKYTKEV